MSKEDWTVVERLKYSSERRAKGKVKRMGDLGQMMGALVASSLLGGAGGGGANAGWGNQQGDGWGNGKDKGKGNGKDKGKGKNGKTGVCESFKRNGHCGYGEWCRYAYTAEGETDGEEDAIYIGAKDGNGQTSKVKVEILKKIKGKTFDYGGLRKTGKAVERTYLATLEHAANMAEVDEDGDPPFTVGAVTTGDGELRAKKQEVDAYIHEKATDKKGDALGKKKVMSILDNILEQLKAVEYNPVNWIAVTEDEKALVKANAESSASERMERGFEKQMELQVMQMKAGGGAGRLMLPSPTKSPSRKKPMRRSGGSSGSSGAAAAGAARAAAGGKNGGLATRLFPEDDDDEDDEDGVLNHVWAHGVRQHRQALHRTDLLVLLLPVLLDLFEHLRLL